MFLGWMSKNGLQNRLSKNRKKEAKSVNITGMREHTYKTPPSVIFFTKDSIDTLVSLRVFAPNLPRPLPQIVSCERNLGIRESDILLLYHASSASSA